MLRDQDTSENNRQIDYCSIIEQYPWIVERENNAILSPDSDGFLCGLAYSYLLNWRIVGYYDGKNLILENGLSANQCVFLDMDIFRNILRSVGHHMVLYNKNRIPENWDQYSNCIQLNNIRNFDAQHDFQRKYPFGTIHFLLGILQSQKIIDTLSNSSIWALLFTDGVWNNLFGYTENCLDWLNFLGVINSTHILNPVFCGNHTIYDVMDGINCFLRMRDSYNATGQYVNGTFISGARRRTGDKLRISDTSGDPINLVQDGDTFHIHENEASRITNFIGQLAEHMGWNYVNENWCWAGFRIFQFTKSDFNRRKGNLNTSNFNTLLQENPLSWAITSSLNMEFTLEMPDSLQE